MHVRLYPVNTFNQLCTSLIGESPLKPTQRPHSFFSVSKWLFSSNDDGKVSLMKLAQQMPQGSFCRMYRTTNYAILTRVFSTSPPITI